MNANLGTRLCKLAQYHLCLGGVGVLSTYYYRLFSCVWGAEAANGRIVLFWRGNASVWFGFGCFE
ncbi:hypothetical protein D3C87_1797420 [compost metagenome]